MVNINLSATFLRYAVSTCTRAIPLLISLYNSHPEEREGIGYLSAFLTTLKSVLALSAHEEDPRTEVIPWDYLDPNQMDDLVNNLLNDFEEEI